MFFSVTTLIGGNYWAAPFVLTGKLLQFFIIAVALFQLSSLNLFLPAGSLGILTLQPTPPT